MYFLALSLKIEMFQIHILHMSRGKFADWAFVFLSELTEEPSSGSASQEEWVERPPLSFLRLMYLRFLNQVIESEERAQIKLYRNEDFLD